MNKIYNVTIFGFSLGTTRSLAEAQSWVDDSFSPNIKITVLKG